MRPSKLYGTNAVLICFLVIAGLRAYAQTSSIGVRGGYQLVLNTSTLPVIPGSTDCGIFGNGNSNGFFGGLTGEYALFGDALELSGGILYSLRPATLTATISEGFEVLDPQTNSYVPLVRTHTLTSSLGYLVVEAGIRSRPLDWLPLYIRLVADAGNPIVDATYTQTEQIDSPSGVLFPDDTRKRTNASGEFPGLSSAFGVTGALGAVIPLSTTVELCPEVFYRHGLNSITSEGTWNQSMMGGGLQLRYRFVGAPPPPPAPEPVPEPLVVEAPPPPEPPAVIPPPPATIASVSSAPLEIRETVVTQTFPLLPYLFFDSASAAVRAQYTFADNTQTFEEKELPKQTLLIYYRILDIVGARLRRNSAANLTITGTTDGLEVGSGTAHGLATQRAQAVVDYLTSRWGIAASRFKVRTVEKPSLVSNEAYQEGVEENRRVELSSNVSGLLDPVVHTRFNEYVPVQPRHDFSVSVTQPGQSSSWNLSVSHNARNVANRTGTAAPPAMVSFDLNQEMTDQLGPVVGATDTLDAAVNIRQVDGGTVGAATRFPLIKTVSNYEVSRLSLIVFDYDRADISEQNKEMMRRVVRMASGSGSTATIVGSTDRLGELKHNLGLSAQRASSVEAFVRSIAPDLKITEVKGIGPALLPYSNDLPEGRFYCRTVSLTITTPLRER